VREPLFLFNQPSATKACSGGKTEAGRGIGGYYEKIDANRENTIWMMYHDEMLTLSQSTRREIKVSCEIANRG